MDSSDNFISKLGCSIPVAKMKQEFPVSVLISYTRALVLSQQKYKNVLTLTIYRIIARGNWWRIFINKELSKKQKSTHQLGSCSDTVGFRNNQRN